MPIQIGARAESFQNPLGLLTDCHRRIEMFLGALLTVAEQAGGGALNAQQRDALEKALRYFREAAPKHTADEEESLFPRLRQVDSADVRRAMEQIDTLEREHRIADRQHAEADRLGSRWLEAGMLSGGEFEALRRALFDLHAIYQRHIAIEDEQVFPLARRVLPAEEQKAVGEEMASRRGAMVKNSG